MSWSINHTGTRAAVQEKVLANAYIPANIRQVILDVLADARPNLPNGVSVVGHGHTSDGSVNSHYSNVGELRISPVALDL